MEQKSDFPSTLQEIVRFALQLEEDGLRMYREYAEKSEDEFAKRTFEGLVEDEQEHLEMLRRIYAASNVEDLEDIVNRSKHEPPVRAG